MEPITLIVTALAMGAAAAARQIGGQAVQDAYNAIRHLIEDRYKRGGAIQALQEDPSSETQKNALKESLVKVGAEKDPEVLKSAGELTRALESVPPQVLTSIGLNFQDVNAVNVHLQKIRVTGPGIGALVSGGTIAGEFTTGDIEVGGGNPSPN
jgi:hypothetical protein